MRLKKSSRAESPQAAFHGAHKAILKGRGYLHNNPDPNSQRRTDAQSALNWAGKDILRLQSGQTFLPEISDLSCEIQKHAGEPWYENDLEISEHVIENAVVGITIQVLKVIQTTTRHTAQGSYQPSKAKRLLSGICITPQADMWDEGLPATEPQNPFEDQQLSQFKPLYIAAPLQEITNRIQATGRNLTDQHKIVQAAYWELETLAARIRKKVSQSTLAAPQSLILLREDYQAPQPLTFADGTQLHLNQPHWHTNLKQLAQELWAIYMTHPEDRTPNNPAPKTAFQQLGASFYQATGNSMRFN